MISKLDIIKLQDLPIEQVAEALQMTVKHHKAICPFHTDSRPSLTFNRARNRYRCYVCDARGGTIDLVMHTQGWNFRDSCHWLANQFGITISDERDYHPQQIKKFMNNSRSISDNSRLEETPDIPYLERLMAQPVLNSEACKFLFNDRKLSRKVIEQLDISSISYSCPMSSSPKPSYFNGPALLIPYRDINGNLLSVQSRYLGTDDKPRFRFPKGSRCTIFNLNVLKTCKPNEPVFITEGVTDCLAILSAGFKAIAIPSATLLNDQDKQTLLSLSLTWHMYPDADDPGNNLFCQLKALLPQLVRHDLPSGFKDVGQYYAFIHKDDKNL